MGLLDQALSFAQGASNGVAGSLTGPVDGLAWLLRQAGVPVPQAPLGGSDWMRNVGLMQEPKERMAGLLGEGIGSALPAVIGAKAPQIAGGLLQMERNAMMPRTLNPQAGVISGDWVDVFHGTDKAFDPKDFNTKLAGSKSLHESADAPVAWTTRSPKVANMFATNNAVDATPIATYGPRGGGLSSIRTSGILDGGNVQPLQVKLNNPKILRGAEAERLIFGTGDYRGGGADFLKIVEEARSAGHDGIVIKANPRGALEFRAEQYLPFDPSSQMRSKFDK